MKFIRTNGVASVGLKLGQIDKDLEGIIFGCERNERNFSNWERFFNFFPLIWKFRLVYLDLRDVILANETKSGRIVSGTATPIKTCGGWPSLSNDGAKHHR